MSKLTKRLASIPLVAPWLVESIGYSFVIPFILKSPPIALEARILILTTVLVASGYADRKLWKVYVLRGTKSAPQLSQAVTPIVLGVIGGLVFGLVPQAAIVKMLVLQVIFSFAKYFLYEIQSLTVER